MSSDDSNAKNMDESAYEFPAEPEDKSTILTIECRSSANDTAKALQSAYDSNTFEREYEFLFFRWPDAGENFAELRRWLTLEAKKVGLEQDADFESEDLLTTHNIKLSKLKAVIIGWDTGEYGCNVIREIRNYYPNLPVFIVNYRTRYKKDCRYYIEEENRGPKNSDQENSKSVSYGSSLQLAICEFVNTQKLGGSPIVFEGRDMLGNESETLLKKIDTIISNYREAPYWEALKEYAKNRL